MYCSTCGAYVAKGRNHCTECGTRLDRAEERALSPAPRYGAEDRRWAVERPLGICPRCSYQGEGISYFSRGSHAAALVGITVLTAGAMGVGGLVYYLVRREHRVCPRCGKGWGRYGELSLAPTSRALQERREPALPGVGRGSAKQFWSVLLAVMAVLMLMGGILGGEVVPVVVGGVSAAGAWMLRRAANEERQARRAALIAQLQLPVLRLAGERGGRLTVTQVAAALQWPMARAEKVLNSLDDGLRVNSEVTDEGVIVYEFIELLRAPGHSPWIEPPNGSASGDT